jgi:hypothetical protein
MKPGNHMPLGQLSEAHGLNDLADYLDSLK